MTGPSLAGDSSPAAAPSAAARVLVAASCAALLVAPFAGSSGFRTAFLTLSGLALLALSRVRALAEILAMPRAILGAYGAWAAVALASLAWTIDRAHTLTEVRGEIGYTSLAFAVFFVAARRDANLWRAWWLALMAGSVLVFAALGLQGWLGVPLSRHPIEGGPGPWSTHLILVAPLLAVLAWPQPWGLARRAATQAIAWGLLLLALWLTENRIAWAALAAQIAVVLAVSRRTAWGERHAGARPRLLAIALVSVVLAFGASIVVRNAQLFRHADSVTTHLERDLRPALWAEAWTQFKRAPLLGHGFGREILADAFLPHTPAHAEHPAVRHAHNMFVDMALGIGAVGVALLAVLFAALWREYARMVRSPATAPLGILGLALVSGFVVKNFTDDFFYRHNAIVFWAINGMLLGLAQAARERR